MNERFQRLVTSPVAGGVVGVFAGGLTILLIEAAGHQLFGTANPTDPSSVTTPMFLSVLVAWIVGSFVAGQDGSAVVTDSGCRPKERVKRIEI